MRRRQVIDLPSTTGKSLQPRWLSLAHRSEIKGGNKPAAAVRATIKARDQAARDIKVSLPRLKFMGEA